ncbi:hypothetical protein JTE90_009518 [Oedothorax gibbosus]|uniref:TRAF-type domain-containing protein n=1 Tax=Oedothorax gibbosus TaxID=931172 RepID=A0AAV6USX9_9ARAC|nr:hypothetical protein JTE90_009518 [Oedothorax gibbosus]
MEDLCLPTPSTSAEEMVCVNLVQNPDTSLNRKKLKTSDQSELLEDKLHGILCCAVCLDLPKAAAYQCRNGHLMCSQCFNHLLADAHLRIIPGVCATCRSPISKDTCFRNLVVEKAISELPMRCSNCSMKFPRAQREAHDKQICPERQTICCYKRIGCPWSGPFKKKLEHEKRCAQPLKSGDEIKQAVGPNFPHRRPITPAIFQENDLCDYLSFEKIHYNDLKLVGPYQTDGYFIRFETFRFDAFGMQWEVRAYVNSNEADPTLSSERTLSYQLLLKESVERSIHMHYTIVNCPAGEMKIKPKVEDFTFSSKNPESHFALLPLVDSMECYRLLSGTIKFRLIMFWNDSREEVKT